MTATQAGNLESQLGSSIIGSTIGQVAGLAFAGADAKSQESTQQALNQEAEQMQEVELQQSENEQYDLWQKTNYPQQVQELNEAGLNPALLYAKGGPGGTTGTSGFTSAAQAPSTSIGQTAAIAAGSQETAADIKLKNAQAANIDAQTPQEADLMQAQIANLTKDVENTQAKTNLIKVQTVLESIDANIKGDTQDDQIASIRASSGIAQQQFQIIARNNSMDATLLNTKIDQANAVLVGTYLTNQLTQSNLQVNSAQIAQIANAIVQSRNTTAINRQNANTAQQNADTNAGTLQLQQMLRAQGLQNQGVDQFMQGISKLVPILINNIPVQ